MDSIGLLGQWESITSFISAIGILIAIGISAIAIIITNKTSQKLTHDTAYKDVDDQIIDCICKYLLECL
jgi:hypothetical protein